MRTIISTLCLTLAVLVGSAGVSWAGISDRVIKRCWDNSLEARSSPITTNIINGMGNTIDCLESAIVRHFNQRETRVLSNNTELDEQNAENRFAILKKNVSDLSIAIGRFYYTNYEFEYCDEYGCGSAISLHAMGDTADFLGVLLSHLKNEKKQGTGAFNYSDGTTYVGEFRNNKYHGQGTYTRSDGTVKEGIWENGCIEYVCP